MLEMRIFGCKMMVLFLAFFCINAWSIAAQTHNQDYAVLKALTDGWQNLPQNWKGNDPCGSRWDVISCHNSRIITITLASMGLTGQLTGDLASLSELQILDLSYNKGLTGSLPSSIGKLSKLTTLILVGCGFSGTIPDSVGSLKKLVYLSLNSNSFTGEMPASIGSLKKLYWLDLSDNKLSGRIPVSNGSQPGLDLLLHAKHFHFGQNQFSGEIPPSLFNSDMILIHVLFDNNNLTGSIPETLGLVQSLESIRFDRNALTGPLPSNLNNLTSAQELTLSNNALTGPVPNLTGMNNLVFVDLSKNSFAPTAIPEWFSTILSLTTVLMEQTGLEGKLPTDFFSMPRLQTVNLKSNQINGTLGIGSSYSHHLQFIDLQNNSVNEVELEPGYNYTLMLSDNPVCQNHLVTLPYCNNSLPNTDSSSYKTPTFCVHTKCTSDQISSPSCKCAYPYTGTFFLRAPSFSALGNDHYFSELQQDILSFLANSSLPVESVSLSNVAVDSFGYLTMHLAFFPANQDYFNRTAVSALAFMLSNQTYQPPEEFKPYVFHADNYTPFEGTRNHSHNTALVGAIIGVSILLLLLVCAGVYAYKQRKISWDSQGTSGDVPQLKGARFFTFEEVLKCTNNFSEANNVGAGGYGKVYRGVLPDGQIVAIKRSQQGSMQGSREFKNEIELLSRVHHKNLVKLIGFCFDQGEQMLVYEFIPNGTLMDSLSGKSGIQLDWIRRLKVALGSARGLQYLHELADPPIIHRDIKSNNILLDERLSAKVADFGLSRLFGDTDKGYVTTQLTEKSDVFGFGVVLLELLTARAPIQQGKYIVKVTKETIDKTQDLYNLSELIDPMLLASSTMLVGFEKFVDMTMKCVEEFGVDRPTTGEVVKELEAIMQLAGMNPNDESTTTSQSYGTSSGQSFGHLFSDDSLLENGERIQFTKTTSK
ncbi:hypothetical protein RDABS01_033752 [Bienertia sinuspersici]